MYIFNEKKLPKKYLSDPYRPKKEMDYCDC